jgi:ribose transport system ATP-binding protein
MEMEPVDFGGLVSDLPLPTLRMLDLARSLSHDPQLLLLDEITAALPSDLAERVVRVMQHWRERDRAVLFITHRLAEVRAVCDRATVLRDGRDVGTVDPRTSDEESIVQLMLGPVAADVQAAQTEGAPTLGPASGPPGASGEPMLHVADLRVGTAVNGMTFDVRAGEVLGVAALEGQGQDALFDALAGRRHADGGEIAINGRALHLRNPYDAIRAGMVLVPSDRLQALLPQRSVRENIAVPLYNRFLRWGPINTRGENRRVRDAIRRLQIDTRAQRQVRRLSGGNQQKVTIGRWLASGFEVLLLFDPTRGIDVGTKRQIYTLLRELASTGAAILLFTSELPEIQLACDRVIVLYEGQIVNEMPAGVADEATLLRAAHGLTEEAASA